MAISFLAAVAVETATCNELSSPMRYSNGRRTCSMSVTLACNCGGSGWINPRSTANSRQPAGSCALTNSQSSSVAMAPSLSGRYIGPIYPVSSCLAPMPPSPPLPRGRGGSRRRSGARTHVRLRRALARRVRDEGVQLCGRGGDAGKADLRELDARRDERGERLGLAPDPQHELARVRDDAASDREEREEHPLGTRGLQRGRQRQPLRRRQDVVGQETQPVPRRVRAEASAGWNGRRQIVLRHVVHMLDRACLLPVPPDELGGRELAAVADNSEVLGVVASAEEVPLLLADAQRHVAERLGILRPVPGGKLDVGAHHRLRRPVVAERPRLLRQTFAYATQRLAHVGADREADRRSPAILALWVREPPEDLGLVARAVGAKVERGDARGQRREAPLDER